MDLIGRSKYLPLRQLNCCSVTRPFLSLRRVWLARPGLRIETVCCVWFRDHIPHHFANLSTAHVTML